MAVRPPNDLIERQPAPAVAVLERPADRLQEGVGDSGIRRLFRPFQAPSFEVRRTAGAAETPFSVDDPPAELIFAGLGAAFDALDENRLLSLRMFRQPVADRLPRVVTVGAPRSDTEPVVQASRLPRCLRTRRARAPTGGREGTRARGSPARGEAGRGGRPARRDGPGDGQPEAWPAGGFARSGSTGRRTDRSTPRGASTSRRESGSRDRAGSARRRGARRPDPGRSRHGHPTANLARSSVRSSRWISAPSAKRRTLPERVSSRTRSNSSGVKLGNAAHCVSKCRRTTTSV